MNIRSAFFCVIAVVSLFSQSAELRADGHERSPLSGCFAKAIEPDRLLACVGSHIDFCWENEDLTFSLGACLSQEEALWNAKVRLEFEEARKSLVSVVPVALSLTLDREMRDAQEAWLRYRATQCKSLRTVFGLVGPSAERSLYCSMNMAVARLIELRSLRENSR